jgi:hypothetical protein
MVHARQCGLELAPHDLYDLGRGTCSCQPGAQVTIFGAVVRLQYAFTRLKWRPHGDSNPGSHRERVVS